MEYVGNIMIPAKDNKYQEDESAILIKLDDKILGDEILQLNLFK